MQNLVEIAAKSVSWRQTEQKHLPELENIITIFFKKMIDRYLDKSTVNYLPVSGLRVVFGKTKIAMKDLVDLEAGDIVLLHSQASDSVDIFVKDTEMYAGRTVRKQNSLAVQISECLNRVCIHSHAAIAFNEQG
ncbi:MAG: FliM/FliN family flagellar motor C-terminal domain-containing protein [bacterium]